jgi:hypothetical protein
LSGCFPLAWRFAEKPVLSASSAFGVAHPAVCTMTCSEVIAVLFAFVPSLSPIRCFIRRCASGVLLSSRATGVGHPANWAIVATVAPRACPFHDDPAVAMSSAVPWF